MGGPYKGVNAICHWMLSRLRPISGLNPVEAAYRYTYYCIPLLLLPHRHERTDHIALTSLIMP